MKHLKVHEVYTTMVEERNEFKEDLIFLMKDIGSNFIHVDIYYKYYKVSSILLENGEIFITSYGKEKNDKKTLSSKSIRFEVLGDIVDYLLKEYPASAEKYKIRKSANKYNL